jgi:hypothetical protein
MQHYARGLAVTQEKSWTRRAVGSTGWLHDQIAGQLFGELRFTAWPGTGPVWVFGLSPSAAVTHTELAETQWPEALPSVSERALNAFICEYESF